VENGSQRRTDIGKPNGRAHRRIFSEAVDIEQVITSHAPGPETIAVYERAAPTRHSLNEILAIYGFSQYVCALIGSFGITPSVAASNTMYTVSSLSARKLRIKCLVILTLLFQLRAEKVAPQLGSILFLSVFYLTDFRIISVIPKPAFSSLLVLAW